MKKTFILCAAALLLAASVFTVIKVAQPRDSIIIKNAEALADDESSTPQIPCLKAVSICYYYIKDASGDLYLASTTGMRHI